MEFGAPKAILRARVILPAVAGTSRASMATALFAALVADALNEVAYDAELAGLSWGVDAAYQSVVPGLDVRVSGYNDKLPVLLREVLARVTSLTVRPERFAVIKERFVLALRNWRAKQPYMWASRLLEQSIMNGAPPTSRARPLSCLHRLHRFPAAVEATPAGRAVTEAGCSMQAPRQSPRTSRPSRR